MCTAGQAGGFRCCCDPAAASILFMIGMSRYSAQILICCIAFDLIIVYRFYFQFLCGLGWEPCISGLPPLSIVKRMRLLIRQWTLPACLPWVIRCSRMKTLFGIYATELAKKIDAIHINGIFQYRSLMIGELFHTCQQFYCTSAPESHFRGIKLGQVRFFWKSVRSRICQLSHSGQMCFKVLLPNSEAWKWWNM